jgi:arginase family enzyme
MTFPFKYDHGAPLAFGGALPEQKSFDDSAIVILPVPVDRTTSYVGGTRNGPREILQASSHMELWDEELGVDIHPHGTSLRRTARGHRRDQARRTRDFSQRQVSGDARRRAFNHATARGCRVGEVSGSVGVAD